MYPALLLGLAVTLGAPAKKEEPKKEPVILGEWIAEKMSAGGLELPLPKDKELHFTFEKEGKLAIADGGKVENGTYKLDSTKDPAQIDLSPPADSKEPVLQGIFSINGDTLLLCLAEGKTNARPTKFESSKEAPFILVTFKRAKK
jgi:uncharacterized protein (TIGR03067 family)